MSSPISSALAASFRQAARLGDIRAQRTFCRHLAQSRSTMRLTVLACGIPALLLMLAAVILPLMGGNYTRAALIAVLEVVAVGAAALALSLVARSERVANNALGDALSAVATRVRAEMSPGTVIPAIDWLDRHWMADAPLHVMTNKPGLADPDTRLGREENPRLVDSWESSRWTLTGTLRGTPFLVVVVRNILEREHAVYVFYARPPNPLSARHGDGAERLFEVVPTVAGVMLANTRCVVALQPELLERTLLSFEEAVTD